MLKLLWLSGAVAVSVAGVALAQPLGTSFTYQGELRSAGLPAAGLHDLRFRLYDAATGGTQIGVLLCSDNVMLSEGRFTAVLDFGAQFAGQQRYLEIEVRQDTGLACANPAGFTILGPRVAMTATPNAAFALNAASATNATSASTAATATNATQLNGQGASFYQNAANLSAGTIPDGRLLGTYSGVISLNNVGNTIIGTHSGSGAGLTGLNASNIVSGTLDTARLPIPLSLSGSSIGTGIINGVNTSALGAIGVFGRSNSTLGETHGVWGQSDSNGGNGVFGWATASIGSTYGVRGQSDSTSGSGVWGYASASSGNTRGGRFQSDSSAGIAVFGLAPASTGTTYGVWGQSAGANGNGVFGWATAGTGSTYGVRGQSDSTSGSAIWGYASASSGETRGGRFQSDSTAGIAVFGLAAASSGNNYGVWGQSNSTSGRGIFGVAQAGIGVTYGVYGQNASTSGLAVYGYAHALTGNTAGGQFDADSNSGSGVVGWATSPTGSTFGVRGLTDSSTGVGVLGYASATTGDARGGRFISESTAGRGVIAAANATSGATVGGEFWSASTAGIGVVGYAVATTGVTHGGRFQSDSTSGRGLLGWATAANGATYGVTGQANSPAGVAIFAFGNSGASGSKSFRIDHPADPENKYLLHYSAESPEVINFYSGKVTLDEAGEAIVELPAYFARVNKDPRYTLTAVGAPMPMLHVAVEISDDALAAGEKAAPGEPVPVCIFRIAGGAPGAKVSWRIEAVRNDLWMRHRAAPVEAEKEGREKGTYQHPEFYGLPAERGMNADHLAPPAPVEPAQVE